jgi:hypothetical protein
LVFGWLYELIGYAGSKGVLMSLVYRVITWILGFIGYLAYLQMRPALRQAEEAAPVENAKPCPVQA